MVAIASSLSSSMNLLEEGLKLMRSSATLEYVSYSGFSLVLKVGLATTRNRELCLQFLQRCADYRETMVAFYTSLTVWPAPSREVESPDLQERAMRPQFETSVSAASTTRVKGLSSYL
jgi:hypothetical protein